MGNYHADVKAYHDEAVTLPEKERREMRERRDTNRQRLNGGLKRDGEPAPIQCRSQGSYSMRTMVQQPDRDYDIDDGVYFDKEKLQGPRGGDRSAGDAREMVREALHSDQFKRPPEKLKNCVRVYYDAGYHVDVPVYRQVTEMNIWGERETWYELASTDWKYSNPLAVTQWFLEENKARSPNPDNGGQLRRVVRFLKAFSRSRSSWRERIATGFMISKLVVEQYAANEAREDKALYDTMVGIRNRLNSNLEIEHPTVQGEMLTKGSDDARADFLRQKLDWAIDKLAVLSESDCTREQGLKAWDQVFDTTFFSERLGDEKKGSPRGGAPGTSGALLITSGNEAANRNLVDRGSGGRYA